MKKNNNKTKLFVYAFTFYFKQYNYYLKLLNFTTIKF